MISKLGKKVILNAGVSQNENHVLSLALAGFEDYSTEIAIDLCKWSIDKSGKNICKDSIKIEGRLNEELTNFYISPGRYSGRIDISYYTFHPLLFNYRANLGILFGDIRRLESVTTKARDLSECEWYESERGERFLYYKCPELLLSDEETTLKFENIESFKFNTMANFSLYLATVLGISASPPVYNAVVVPLIFGTGYFNNRIKLLNSNQREPFLNADKSSY
ncbi:hypothetical protein [Leptospira wolffii]|uniref:hypothetical protein n=1 Tax=Leptospira wolffii TaxID=409998 RepID=UPI000301DFB7|nr:hypothetical protein [Leptospira wolffii]EPG68151.1 hypothetical protein LEP1GSC061_0973 [Leptospira wolffii serovar Khorat str. Khorat-H2]